VEHVVEYPDTNGVVPSRESVEVFKGAALRLLDRLAKDASQLSRKEGWLKVSTMVEEISGSRAAWMADVMVAAVNGEYSDKLGTSIRYLGFWIIYSM
jgi:ATP-dependent Lon protease